MLPSRSLLFALNRFSSFIANSAVSFHGASITISYNNTSCNHSRLLSSIQQQVNAAGQYTVCSSKVHVRLLNSFAAPPDNQNQGSSPEIVEWLRNNGFPEDACSQISAKLPSSHLDLNKLNRTMSHWGACQFGHDRLVHLLTENPDLLLVDHQRIMSCFTFLSKDFTQNYVYKLLLNCPQVLFEKHSEILSKLDFLNKQLGIPNSEIVTSSSLGHPLEHMRTRYEFLKRCGLYKPGSEGVKRTNPSLSDMFDTPDEQFAKQVARLSPLEFDVFTQLYALEIEDEDDLSDSDSD
uniref:mTERF domain-containing protein 2 n=1 Tax=Lygus hesperus TaxID=30085 RepID=A0A0A9ZHL6_LYGHE